MRPNAPPAFSLVVAVIVASACGPNGGGPDGAGTTGMVVRGSTDSSGVADLGPSTGDSSGGAADSIDSGSVDPCAAFDAAECPAQCATLNLYADAEDQPCGSVLGNEVTVCVTAGQTPTPGPMTYFGQVDGVTRYALYNQPCVDTPSVVPAGWVACGSTATEPPSCACLCGVDGCPSELEQTLLDQCDLPTLCKENPIGSRPGAELEACVLSGLRDRTPGVYGVRSGGATIQRNRVYVAGADEVQLLQSEVSGLCFTPLAGAWEPTQLCTLQSSTWFEACLAGQQEPEVDCMRGENWFTECQPQPAACIGG